MDEPVRIMPIINYSRTAPWKNPLLWVFAGLMLRLAYLVEQQTSSVLFYQPLLDEQEMVSAARQLLAGGGFGHEPLFKAPLYPIYLAGVMLVSGGGWFFLARMIQHFLGGALILMACDTARRCTGGPTGRGRLAGAVAACAVALYGPLIRLENSLILDFFAVFLQSFMVWALVRMRTTPRPQNELKWAALAGVAAMLSWLNRPTLTPVLPFLALWIVGWRVFKPQIKHPELRRRLACAALFLLFPLIGIGLVYWRNATVGGEGMALPWQSGYSFYYANGTKANGKYYIQDTFSLARTGNPTRELAEAGWRKAVAQGGTPPARAGRTYHAIDDYWMSRTKDEIRRDPGRWLALMAKKILYLPSAREIFNFEVYEVHKELSWILRWMPLSFGLLWPLALGSVALGGLWPRGRRGLRGLLWLYTILLGGAIALYYTSGRLRLPLVFPAAVLAGGFVANVYRLILICCSSYGTSLLSHIALIAPRWGRLVPPGHAKYINRTGMLGTPAFVFAGAMILVLMGGIMSWGDWWGVRSESLRHIEYARLSNAAWRAAEYEKALQYADACNHERPDYPSTSLLRGQALYSLGKIQEAAAAFTESLARLPQDPVAAFNLGIIYYYDRPEPKRAAAAFEEALRRQPQYHQAAWMGALARLGLGEREQARELLRRYLPIGNQNAPERLLIAATALHLADGNPDAAKKTAQTIARIGGPSRLKELANELKILGFILP